MGEKLSYEQIREACFLHEIMRVPQAEIAERYNISQPAVSQHVNKGKQWAEAREEIVGEIKRRIRPLAWHKLEELVAKGDREAIMQVLDRVEGPTGDARSDPSATLVAAVAGNAAAVRELAALARILASGATESGESSDTSD